MLTKIKRILENQFWRNFKDVRLLGILAFGLIALLTAYSGIKVIGKNYTLQQEIARLDGRNRLYKMENENLKLGNKYFETDTYLELTARQQFSKAYPGETMVIVSSDESAAAVSNMKVAAKTDEPDNEKPAYQKNLEAWKNFFFRRDIE